MIAERIRSPSVQELGRRERKKLATRRALEESAMRLFTEKGFDGTTVEEIADAADVSARTFFRYFATKDEVLFGDHEPRLESMRELLAARPADEPLMASLEVLLRSLGDTLVAHRDRALVQSEVSKARVQILGLFRQHQEEMNEVIATFVATRLSGHRPGADAGPGGRLGGHGRLPGGQPRVAALGRHRGHEPPHGRGPRGPAQRAGGRTRLTTGPLNPRSWWWPGSWSWTSPRPVPVVVVVAAAGVTFSRSITKTSASFLAMSP